MSISSRKIEKGRYTFTIIMRDITFQKEAKKQLVEKANELRKVNKELEDFVYIVSHDLKEPLFAIGGYTSRLFMLYEDTFDDKGKQYIDRIKVNIERMSQKIQEIMEVLKAGRVAYDFKNNDSGAIVTDVVNTLESKMKAERIKVSIEDNLPTILCDEKRMKDVFSNLVTNAIKFMGEDKQRQVRIGCNKNGDYYKFFVEDTGISIREEYREQIFKVFRRLKDVETEGTGVGLAIVKKIVEQHKGKIWAESPAGNGRGTRFCFTIPVTKTTSDHHDTYKVMAGSYGNPVG
jgi:light-regulated signal transduction histidine kinase (bacteriophytochrome)